MCVCVCVCVCVQKVIQSNPGQYLRPELCLNLCLLLTLANDAKVATRSKQVLQRTAEWYDLDHLPSSVFRL